MFDVMRRKKGHFIVWHNANMAGEVYEYRDPHDGTFTWNASVEVGEEYGYEHYDNLPSKWQALAIVEELYGTRR